MLIPTTQNGGQTIEMMEESLLVKKQGVDMDSRAEVHWVEYWLEGKLVHRSAHVKLGKQPE